MRFLFLNILILFNLLIIYSCGSAENKNSKLIEFKGLTMGSGYSISYRDSLNRNFQPQIDSFLAVFDKEISTYRDDSRLSSFNHSDSGIFISRNEPLHLVRNFQLSGLFHGSTAGWFNPTVMPLVNYWGFGKDGKKGIKNPDDKVIDSLKKICNFSFISINETPEGFWLKKNNPKTQIVLNAIAPGDAADQIGKMLESAGIKDYMVEIGGEVRARGLQSATFGWMIGINTPVEGAAINDLQIVVELNNKSLATSGNYRNFIEVNGQKYVHTINPFTGYTEKNNLLSASIFVDDCAAADAIATACMAMGMEKAWSLVNSLNGVDAYFIYTDSEGKMQVKFTDAVGKWIKK
jgi:thiamine biosynthesis lipoprotein